MVELKVRKSASNCLGCGKKFQHQEDHHSALLPGSEDTVREDYCPECWKRVGEDCREAAICSWVTSYVDPAVESIKAVEHLSPLRRLFYEICESDEPNKLAMAFLSAHLLRRQRAFRLLKEFEDSQRKTSTAVFLDKVNGRIIEVADPDLSAAQMNAARLELQRRLEEMEGEESDAGT